MSESNETEKETDTAQTDTHDAWLDAWEMKFKQDGDGEALRSVLDNLAMRKVRVTMHRGSSEQHPEAERITTEGVVVGTGRDVLWGENEDGSRRTVTRTSIVLDNGHAHFIKPGMSIETEEHVKGEHVEWAEWKELILFP